MQGFIYIALPTNGDMTRVKIGYTTNTLRERMQKGARARKFSIVSAVGVSDEADYVHDITALLRAVEGVAHYKATASGLLRMVSHDWMMSTPDAWVSIAEMFDGRIFEGLIYRAFEMVDPRIKKYLVSITL